MRKNLGFRTSKVEKKEKRGKKEKEEMEDFLLFGGKLDDTHLERRIKTKNGSRSRHNNSAQTVHDVLARY